MAKLYVIGTPIGNLEDITLRAIRVLGEIDFVLCEDTRETAKLLQKYNIQKPLISYNSHSTEGKSEKILALLGEGKKLALVSDAGTPGISDPGCLIVKEVREKFGNSVEIIAVPGPSALVSALSVSGMPTSDFLFLGFLPHKKGRETLFKEIAESERTVVFYESPHRILKTLESLKNHLNSERKIMIARELTKIFEETVSGSAEKLLEFFTKNSDKIRGEFVVIISSI
jgi:16S rRNA (cytidine1402-2'-O)-methyltransferase